jgi:hypothetical protein
MISYAIALVVIGTSEKKRDFLLRPNNPFITKYAAAVDTDLIYANLNVAIFAFLGEILISKFCVQIFKVNSFVK